MPVKASPFTRRQLLSAATTKPWTQNFRHLLPVPKKFMKRTSVRDPLVKSVRPKDRIKYWNVVPGDQIRLLGDKKNTLHEVLSINRFSNRVFVKGAVNAGEEDSGKIPPSKNYHYSRCQLFLGNYELPPSKKSPEPQVVPHDTTKEEVMKVTYTPPSFTPTMRGLIPRPSEAEFLRVLYNPHLPNNFGDSPPVEGYLFRELANPHSRAKKHARWLAWQVQKKQRLEQYFQEKLSDLRGRSVREAKAEAAFKWRRDLEEEKEALRKQRWKKAMGEEALAKQSKRRDRKEAKQRQRLTQLVLKDEPNQFIPKDMRS
ncbi:hypothetical protein DXG03_007410 [Asterophora parasitica]|uniref:Uncharacterized protein n=1 Tax=Asterophora parasitica TaxID=117018 RepID=A0A9P7G8Y9_9AGAR|nr:hypothetical protein DXG03_007410 [Asterophora parasitica]